MLSTRFTGFTFEARIVLLVACAQFLSGLEFSILLPLGPQLARSLDMPEAQVGLITSSYAVAAFLSGLTSAGMIDRFDRRKALGLCLCGLVLATGLCGLAPTSALLLAARFLAGAFAGPVMALGMTLVSEFVPDERHGTAVTTIITAGSIASIIGLPSGIALAEVFGWRMPLLLISAAGLVLLLATLKTLPPMTGHLALGRNETLASKTRMMASPIGLTAVIATVLSAASAYAIVANVPVHLQRNLHVPSVDFTWLYMIGGCTAFVVTRISGKLIDRFGSWPVMLTSNLVFITVVWELFVMNAALAPITLLFVGSMTGNALRNASLQTALTRIAPASRRGAFLSVTGSMTQLGSALGAGASSFLLYETAGEWVGGMDRVGWASITLTATLTPLVLLLGTLRNRDVKLASHTPA